MNERKIAQLTFSVSPCVWEKGTVFKLDPIYRQDPSKNCVICKRKLKKLIAQQAEFDAHLKIIDPKLRLRNIKKIVCWRWQPVPEKRAPLLG